MHRTVLHILRIRSLYLKLQIGPIAHACNLILTKNPKLSASYWYVFNACYRFIRNNVFTFSYIPTVRFYIGNHLVYKDLHLLKFFICSKLQLSSWAWRCLDWKSNPSDQQHKTLTTKTPLPRKPLYASQHVQHCNISRSDSLFDLGWASRNSSPESTYSQR